MQLKYIDIIEQIRKLPRNILGLNQLNKFLRQYPFRGKESKELAAALRTFFDNYLAGFSGLMIPLKKVYFPGAALGQLFFPRLPLPNEEINCQSIRNIVTERKKELRSEKAMIQKLKYERIQELKLEDKTPEQYSKEPLLKDLDQLENRYQQTIAFLKKLNDNYFAAEAKFASEYEENELTYLQAIYQRATISADMNLVKKPVVLFREKVTIQDFSEIVKCTEKLQALIINKKLSPGLQRLLSYLNLPIVQIEQPLLPEHQGAIIAIDAFERHHQLIINPGKEICTEVLDKQNRAKESELWRAATAAQNLPVTVDKYHMRILANLGSAEIDFPEEIKWMIAENADGAGNIYTEQFIPRYFEELNNWQNYSLAQKSASRLVTECLYPALKMISAQLNRGYPREKFQLHFRAFNIRKNKAAEQKFSNLIGVDINDKNQRFELELLKNDPYRLVFPFLEALILSINKLAGEESPELTPLISYSLPNVSTITDLDLYEKWFSAAYQDLALRNNGLIEKGIMFGSFITDTEEFERFVAELFQRKIKYFLIDSSRWGTEALKQIVGDEYGSPQYAKLPLEIANNLLINMDNNLRAIYNKNEQLPSAERIRLINIGTQPREFPLAAIYFSRTISVPLANIKTLTAKIRATAYQNDELWGKHNLTVSHLMSDNKLLFNNKLNKENLVKYLNDNLQDYRNMDNKINERIRGSQKLRNKTIEAAALFSSTSIEHLRKEQEEKRETGGSSAELPANIIQFDERTFQLNFDITFPKGLHLRPSTALVTALREISRYAESKLLTVENYRTLDDFYQEEFGPEFERFDPLEVTNWSLLQLHFGEAFKLQLKVTNPHRIKMIKTVLAGLGSYFAGGDCAAQLDY